MLVMEKAAAGGDEEDAAKGGVADAGSNGRGTEADGGGAGNETGNPDVGAEVAAASAASRWVEEEKNSITSMGSRRGAPIQISAGERVALEGREELRRLIRAAK